MAFKIAVLASGAGTTFDAIAKKFPKGGNVKPTFVVTNNPKAGVIKRAKRLGVNCLVIPSKGVKAEEHDRLLMEALEKEKPHLVVLAGYLKLVGPKVRDKLRELKIPIINTHPAILPEHGGKGMYGDAVHKSVLEKGDSWSGPTVHYADKTYDTGGIIAQVRVPVPPEGRGLTPEKRLARLRRMVQKAEKRLLVKVIGEFAAGKHKSP